MDLFGRKERIQELEDELASREEELTGRIEELEDRLENEQDRAREAAAAKQEAEETINRLKDRVRSLEDRLDETDGTTMDARERHDLDLQQATELIENLERLAYRSSKATSIYSSPDDGIVNAEQGELIVIDPTIIRHAIIPPLPFTESSSYRSSGFMLEQIREMVNGRYCLLHVTAGGSGAAIIEDRAVQESIIVDADIKSQHTKGGYSQKRFERLRQEQIDNHVDAVLDKTSRLLEQGFTSLFLTGGTDLVDEVRHRIDQETRPFSSRVSRIDDEDDLERSFKTGFRFEILRMDDEKVEEAMERL